MRCKHCGKVIYPEESSKESSIGFIHKNGKYHCHLIDGWWCGTKAEPISREENIKQLLIKLNEVQEL